MVSNLKIHYLPIFQELCMYILIKFFITAFNLFIRVLKRERKPNKEKVSVIDICRYIRLKGTDDGFDDHILSRNITQKLYVLYKIELTVRYSIGLSLTALFNMGSEQEFPSSIHTNWTHSSQEWGPNEGKC